MTANPETLRLYAKIMETPRVGDVPSNKLTSHGMQMPVGDIAKAAAAALRFQADAIAAVQAHICHCDLSGDLHVVTFEPRSCCEVCQIGDTLPLTPENVEGAFKHLGGMISECRNELAAHEAKINATVVDLSATMSEG